MRLADANHTPPSGNLWFRPSPGRREARVPPTHFNWRMALRVHNTRLTVGIVRQGETLGDAPSWRTVRGVIAAYSKSTTMSTHARHVFHRRVYARMRPSVRDIKLAEAADIVGGHGQRKKKKQKKTKKK